MSGDTQLFLRLRSRKDGVWYAHPELRSRLVVEANAVDSSLTDYVNRVLAERYGVPYTPLPRRTRPGVDQHELNVRISAGLFAALVAAAQGRYGKPRAAQEALVTLHQHVGLAMPSPVKRTRRPRRSRSERAAA